VPPAPLASRHTWRSTNPKPPWCGASSPTGPRASRSARSAGGSTPTASPPRRGSQPGGTSTLCRLLGNEAYIGRVYFNRTETIADPRPARRTRQVPRPREDWIPISCPRIITDEQFEAASRVAYDNAKWSPRRAEPGEWLLKGLVKCGPCGVGTNCHKMRGRNGTWHRYYYCRNHDPLRAGGEDRRCPERNIRADALDEFAFDQIRAALTKPEMLLAGEQAIAVTTPIPDDELLAAELARLDRKIDATAAERRRVADLYQAGLIELPELQRRSSEVAARLRDQQAKRDTLGAERTALAHGNLLRRRVTDFARQISEVIDQLDRPQKQQQLRLLIEDVHVTGWQVKIRLRVPLDPPDPGPTRPGPKRNAPLPTTRPTVSSQDRLRSADEHHRRVLPDARPPRPRRQTPRRGRHPLTAPPQPPAPSRDDTGTITCPVCQQPFTPAGRQRYCGDRCRKTAFRRRHQDPPAIAIPAARHRREYTIYECPACGQRPGPRHSGVMSG
jgi:hypothetical protein